MTLLLGAHTVGNGGIHMAAKRAGNAGMTALQIFTAVPKFYNDKASMREDKISRFHEALAGTSIRKENVIVHAGYVLNVASADPAKWERATAGLAKELERSTMLSAGGVCFHPGSAGESPPGEAIERIAKSMTQILEKIDGTTRLLVENTAGGGRTMARTAKEVGEILARLPSSLRARAGYGLDTCHLFASGYNIAESPSVLSGILDEFEKETGEPPSFIHLNDSEGALASNRDRHMLIGEGMIGKEAFSWLLHDRRAKGIPLILETPQASYEIADADDSADAYDVRMMALLKELSPVL